MALLSCLSGVNCKKMSSEVCKRVGIVFFFCFFFLQLTYGSHNVTFSRPLSDPRRDVWEWLWVTIAVSSLLASIQSAEIKRTNKYNKTFSWLAMVQWSGEKLEAVKNDSNGRNRPLVLFLSLSWYSPCGLLQVRLHSPEHQFHTSTGVLQTIMHGHYLHK